MTKIPLNEHQQLVLQAAENAERVLYIFEAVSRDERPRRAVAAARDWAAGIISCGDARKAAFSANAAARGAKDPAAMAAARAAAHAAAAAHVPAHARHAIAYARKALL